MDSLIILLFYIAIVSGGLFIVGILAEAWEYLRRVDSELEYWRGVYHKQSRKQMLLKMRGNRHV